MLRPISFLMLASLLMVGCRQPLGNSPQQPLFGGGGAFNSPAAAPLYGGQQPPAAPPGQFGALNSQLSQFNSDNENLHAQVAALQQRLQNANSYNDQLKQQLGDQMSQLQRTQVQMQQVSTRAQQQIAANQAQYQRQLQQNREIPGQFSSVGGNPVSSQFAGATIRANNGLMQKLQSVQLPGFKAWMDGDVIRIEGPTDRLFVSGTYQVNASDANTMANLANTIRQNFPRQVIGVEAHWDGTPIQPATTSHHQLTATQSLAVFDLLVKSGLPHDQVFTMALGSNRPRYPKGNAANRRIEIVIYPETF